MGWPGCVPEGAARLASAGVHDNIEGVGGDVGSVVISQTAWPCAARGVAGALLQQTTRVSEVRVHKHVRSGRSRPTVRAPSE